MSFPQQFYQDESDEDNPQDRHSQHRSPNQYQLKSRLYDRGFKQQQQKRPVTRQQNDKLLIPRLVGQVSKPKLDPLRITMSNLGQTNSNEMFRTKYVIDKLSGKFQIDQKYLAIMPEDERNYLMGKTGISQMGSRFKLKPLDTDLRISSSGKEVFTQDEDFGSVEKQAQSKLDKYIDLILNNVTNVDEYIYLKREEDEGQNDPYKLVVVDYKTIKGDDKKTELKEYYTISRKGLCHYVNGKPSEFIPLKNWLEERKTYHQIKSLKFFTKFRKWKTLKMWKSNVIKHKTKTIQNGLLEKLFILNPIMRDTLLTVRKHTYDMMESSRFIGFESPHQMTLADSVFTLEQFKQVQDTYRGKVSSRIRQFSQECRKVVQSGYDKSLDILRRLNYVPQNEENFGAAPGRDTGGNVFRTRETAYEALQFPDNMTYERRSQLRKECSKFLRFAYLVDFLAMESLSNIYTLSVRDLITKLNTLVEIDESIVVHEAANRPMVRFDDPLFSIKLECNFIDIPEHEMLEQELPEFIPPPFGNSTVEDFSILYHVHMQEPKVVEKEAPKKGKKADEDEDEEEDDDAGGYDENKVYQRIVVPNISKLWVAKRPTLNTFHADIVKCIGEGLNAIQAFERWSRHNDMIQYVAVLEEWDDIVGEDWGHPESNYLNPSDWLDSAPLESYTGIVKNLLERAFERADLYIEQNFNKPLMMYWEDKQIDIDVFKDEKLAHPGETFQYTLAVLNHQKEFFQQKLPIESFQGLLKIDSLEMKQKIEPLPTELLKQFDNFIQPMLRLRCRELRDWLIGSATSLKGATSNIDDFVKQSNSLKQIQKQLPKIKGKIQLVGHLYNILDEYKIEVKKEDKQAFNLEIIQTQNALEQAIHHAEEGTERHLEKFARDVQHQLIPTLEKAIGQLDSLVQDKKFIDAGLGQENAIKELTEYDEQCKKLEQDAIRFKHYEHTLQLPTSQLQTLKDLRSDLNLRLSMWKSLKEWKELTQQWIDGKFIDINTDEIKAKGDYYTKIVSRCQKDLPSNPILEELRDLVFSFKDTMPVVLALRNKYLKDYHWEQIKGEILQQEFEITETFTLRNLMDMKVGVHQEQIQEVATQATQEAVLENDFNDIEAKWKQLEFITAPYKSDNPRYREVYVLTQIDEVSAPLDDFLANLNNILGNRYLKLMRKKAEKLQKDVLYAQETLDDWLAVQKNWIYLENIFSNADIKQKLKEDNILFEMVDKYFKQIMRKTNSAKAVHKAVTVGLLEKFREYKETLNQIQKALEIYLEEKRTVFPRFYFLSNDELLEILAKSQDLDTIQRNLKKCFEAIYRLDFGEEGSRFADGMISPEGEKIKFVRPTSTKNEVEIWLAQLQDNMIETLQRRMKLGKQDTDTQDRNEWLLKQPAQVVATISSQIWTNETESAIYAMVDDQQALVKHYNQLQSMLNGLTQMVRGELTGLQHKVIVALITQEVHARDIVDTLAEENVSSVTEFTWQQQLRVYMDESDRVIVRQVNARMTYGYEYLGATSRLVITALTDRCWMTITGALNIHLGAAPAGPAGTGKTESTKDLAKALGMFCVVFNCSDQIEYKMMGRLFSGLAQQGAWACLDEFNRIDIEVLSVIAQQLLTIRQALVRADERFLFQEREIRLNPQVGVFITMNPGYAGRTELPDNLKVLFRPVSMMIPDYKLIAEIMLMAEGFEDAKPLSQKMTQLYQLSSQQLSQQDHYDFGMRAVKSVLVMAGALKRAEANMREDVLLIRAMRDSNIPKFLKDDLPLFEALINDLFPDAPSNEVDYGDLKQFVLQSMDKMKLQQVPALVTKVIQLFETFNVRFGVMLVGLTASGKTECYNILQQTMSDLRKADHKDQRYQLVTTYVLNPKCISMGELYGEVNVFTQEWQDGLASQIMREASSDETNERKWVVFDGPVDALWIENMNTVLDDNMMLCLANGQRIKLRSQMRMLFEVQDLKVASPATVSRCGMVYLTQDELGWMPYVLSWLERQFGMRDVEVNQNIIQHEILNPSERKYLLSLYEMYVDDILKKIRKSFRETIPTNDSQLVVSLCNLLDAFLSDKFGFKTTLSVEARKRYILYAFTYGCIWSLGASIEDQFLEDMSDYIRDKFQSIIFPNVETVYSYFLETANNELSFKHWNDKMDDFVYDPTIQFFSMLVPTLDTVRYSYIMEWLLASNKGVYLTGPSGTGKSQIVANLLQQIQEPRMIDPVYTIFSAQTTSFVIQMTIENKLEKTRKALLTSKPGRSTCIFIDDVNMPALEEYGAQPPIELLRLLVDKQFVYDRKERFQKFIENVTLLCCSAPPGGGRNAVTQRFTRHFNMLSLPQASQATLFKIFQSILGGFFSLGFTDAVKRMTDTMTQATIDVYMRITKEKLPIPSKFHYTFNLRDVSKVFQGILMIKNGLVRDADQATKIWIHEVQRVFYDRLINEVDREWFMELTAELLGRQFRSRWTKEEVFGDNKVMYGDLLKLDSDSRDYEEIDKSKMDALIKVLDNKLEEYNYDYNSKTKLVFFGDAVDHILRISRVLRQPRGNAMLIGVGGSGKQSLTRLSAYMQGFTTVSIEITKSYSAENFADFLKEMFKKCGVELVPLCFLFTDSQIVYESFLEDINNILNSGEVPNIWKSDEKAPLLESVKPINAKYKRPEDPDTLYKTFVEGVRNQLHIVLCMSPVGDALRVRCRKFPALVDCCTLDWFSSWPATALVSVAHQILTLEFTSNVGEISQTELIDRLSNMCMEIHISSKDCADKFEAALKRKVFTTPKSYLDLIGLYLSSLKRKRDELELKRRRLGGGLTKLKSANEQVAGLQITLTDLKPQLEEQSIKVTKALEKVRADTLVAAQKESLVRQEAEEVNRKAQDIKIIADDAQADLDKVMPELEKALKAVEKIDRDGLVAVRGFPSPPEAVKMVLEAVCVLLGSKTDWDSAKKLMADLNGFIKQLLQYPKDNIPENKLFQLRKIITREEFVPELIYKKASAAADLAVWCLAMNTYANVSKKVEPKKKKVAEMQASLDAANKVLQQKEAELDIVKQAVMKLQKDTEEMALKLKGLEELKKQTEKRLENAQNLIRLTASEAIRWAKTVEDLGVQIVNLVGDVFLSAAAISYNGPFTGVYRHELVNHWIDKVSEVQIPVSDKFSLISTLGDPLQLRDWTINKLPTDQVSQENAIFATQGYRWPLMIDPQLQANNWIKSAYKPVGLKITKFSENKFQMDMRAAITNGVPILIQDVGEALDPSIETILGKQIKEMDGRTLIRFGDQEIDYDKGFKLFITTKIPNPRYLPEIFIKVTVINFTVTSEGLEEQLLADVVRLEQEQIEIQKDETVMKLAQYRKMISECEAMILRQLAEADPEKILDNVELIESLQSAKDTSEISNIKIEESVILEVKIEQVRNEYRSVAIRGSVLYFVIKDLNLIDPMYQYSLQYVQFMFNQAMQQAKKSNDQKQRLTYLIDNITKVIYTNVCRGLFEQHKLIYSFLISAMINRRANLISDSLWSAFLRGAGVLDKSKVMPNPEKVMISEGSWQLVTFLDMHFEAFKGLVQHVIKNLAAWKLYITSPDPLNFKLEEPWQSKLDSFEKLLIVKIFRSEKILFALSSYVNDQIGRFYLEAPNSNMEILYQDSNVATAIIFVLSQGADPTQQILKFAKERNFEEKFTIISLGQGQGRIATIHIEEAKQQGKWVLLQNCHLARTWMPSLETLVEETALNAATINQDYRLFLTSMPAPYFPVSILQNGIKLTTEPPRGLKANLRRSMMEISDEFLESSNKPEIFHKLAFGLCYFHAIIQERKKFGPLGWNIKYEFNDSDLDTSKTVTRMLLSEGENIPWDAMLFVTGNINYGGRVTDDWDRRCLMTILKKFISTDVLEDNYRFCENAVYKIPAQSLVVDYVAFIDSLPMTDDPSVFGMHENANITFQQRESDAIIETILSIQPRVATGGADKSPDQIVLELVKALQGELPDVLTKEESNKELWVMNPEKNLIPSLSTVLQQEVERFNILLTQMQSTLIALAKAVEGIVVMSQELDSMYFSLINNEVPKLWVKVSYKSMKGLASWMRDLKERVKFMQEWLITGGPNCFWISGFFYPQGFLTGVLQTHARFTRIAIDNLVFQFKVMDVEKEQCGVKPLEGVYIYGLFLEGAQWKKKSMSDLNLGQMNVLMPVIHFLPVQQEKYVARADNYSCPVYKTQDRAGVLSTTGQSTNYVLTVDLPSLEQHPDYWTLRGSAMICSLKD